MWTVENRARYDRGKLRYPSDLTERNGRWPRLRSRASSAKRGGNKRTVDVREVMNGSRRGAGSVISLRHGTPATIPLS